MSLLSLENLFNIIHGQPCVHVNYVSIIFLQATCTSHTSDVQAALFTPVIRILITDTFSKQQNQTYIHFSMEEPNVDSISTVFYK